MCFGGLGELLVQKFEHQFEHPNSLNTPTTIHVHTDSTKYNCVKSQKVIDFKLYNTMQTHLSRRVY